MFNAFAVYESLFYFNMISCFPVSVKKGICIQFLLYNKYFLIIQCANRYTNIVCSITPRVVHDCIQGGL